MEAFWQEWAQYIQAALPVYVQCNVGPPDRPKGGNTKLWIGEVKRCARQEESRPILHGSGKRNLMAYLLNVHAVLGRVCVCVCDGGEG